MQRRASAEIRSVAKGYAPHDGAEIISDQTAVGLVDQPLVAPTNRGNQASERYRLQLIKLAPCEAQLLQNGRGRLGRTLWLGKPWRAQ